jgi:hypothetical protein
MESVNKLPITQPKKALEGSTQLEYCSSCKLLRLMSDIHIPGEHELCSQCEATAELHCGTDGLVYCKPHGDYHRKRYPEHALGAINAPNLKFCAEHKEELVFFCEEDCVTVCRTCDRLDHFGHKVIRLKDAYEKYEGEVAKMVEALRARRNTSVEKRKKYGEKKTSVVMKKDAIRAEIESQFSHLAMLIEQRKASLLQELEETTAEMVQSLDNVVTERHAREAEITKLEDDLQDYQKSKSVIEALVCIQKGNKLLNDEFELSQTVFDTMGLELDLATANVIELHLLSLGEVRKHSTVIDKCTVSGDGINFFLSDLKGTFDVHLKDKKGDSVEFAKPDWINVSFIGAEAKSEFEIAAGGIVRCRYQLASNLSPFKISVSVLGFPVPGSPFEVKRRERMRFVGFVPWDQNGAIDSDEDQDRKMNEAASSKFSGARAASTRMFLDRMIDDLPLSNTSNYFLTFTGPGNEGTPNAVCKSGHNLKGVSPNAALSNPVFDHEGLYQSMRACVAVVI